MKIFYLFILAGILIFVLLVYSHEEVHKTIFESYGIKSNITLYPPETIPETACTNENCNLAHNINESIGYQLIPFYFLILFGFLLIIALIESFEDNLLEYLKHITVYVEKEDSGGLDLPKFQ